MSPVTRAYLFQGLIQHETAKLVLEPIARRLRTDHSADTVDRLFKSKHVNDLRLISAVALILFVWFSGVSALIGIGTGVLDDTTNEELGGLPLAVHSCIAGVDEFLKLFGPTIAVFGAILAWAYQVGSARLGIVDLFACEIDTLCRVTTVTDIVRHQIDMFNDGPHVEISGGGGSRSSTNGFISKENYFPVFESNSSDLKALEAKVVINITAFYTYMKAVRDSLRKLAEMRPTSAVSQPRSDASLKLDPWHESLRNVLYMLYLGLESARKAIDDLVEFEPEQAERMIVILISELPAYRFLRDQYTDTQDMRYQRLILRGAEYLALIPALCQLVETHKPVPVDIVKAEATQGDPDKARQWLQALKLVPELRHRYDELTNLAVDK